MPGTVVQTATYRCAGLNTFHIISVLKQSLRDA